MEGHNAGWESGDMGERGGMGSGPRNTQPPLFCVEDGKHFHTAIFDTCFGTVLVLKYQNCSRQSPFKTSDVGLRQHEIFEQLILLTC